jgi:hypothetical protein
VAKYLGVRGIYRRVKQEVQLFDHSFGPLSDEALSTKDKVLSEHYFLTAGHAVGTKDRSV